jgi:hypothetical protein
MLLLVAILSYLALRLLVSTPRSSWCVDQRLILSTTWREIQSVSIAGCRSNWRIKRRWLPLLSAYSSTVKSTGSHVHPTLVSQYQEVLLCRICCSPLATSCAYLRCLSFVCVTFEVYSVKRSLNRKLYDLRGSLCSAFTCASSWCFKSNVIVAKLTDRTWMIIDHSCAVTLSGILDCARWHCELSSSQINFI